MTAYSEISAEAYARYQAKLHENEKKEIEILKMNNENRCKKCGETYNINVNRADSCGTSPHQPKY